MIYTIVLLRRAQKELGNLSNTEYKQVRDAIADLASDPRPSGCKSFQDATAGEFGSVTTA